MVARGLTSGSVYKSAKNLHGNCVTLLERSHVGSPHRVWQWSMERVAKCVAAVSDVAVVRVSLR